jgi:hypothetical protein
MVTWAFGLETDLKGGGKLAVSELEEKISREPGVVPLRNLCWVRGV